MKKFSYLIAIILIASISFVSCEKDDSKSKEEVPGQIREAVDHIRETEYN